MPDPIDRVIAALPSAFFRAALEQTDSAFMKAARLTDQNIAEPERANTLGQLRHACAEEGFRAAAQEAGLAPMAPHTEPAGGRFSLLGHQGVYLIRSNIQSHCGTPRPTRFRKLWAAVNAWLDPLQLDFLVEVEDPPTDRLCAMLVVTANGKRGDPSIPAFVGLGIPSADLSSWKFLEPLTTVLGMYHDLDTRNREPSDALIEIKDRAVPKLKKRDGNEGK